MNNLAGDALQILSYLSPDPAYVEVTTLLYRRFQDPDEHTDHLARYEWATRNPVSQLKLSLLG